MSLCLLIHCMRIILYTSDLVLYETFDSNPMEGLLTLPTAYAVKQSLTCCWNATLFCATGSYNDQDGVRANTTACTTCPVSKTSTEVGAVNSTTDCDGKLLPRAMCLPGNAFIAALLCCACSRSVVLQLMSRFVQLLA